MAAFPPELFAIIASYAEVDTMKNLRLSSRTVAALTFKSFVGNAFSRVDVKITKNGLKKLQEMCNCASIAPHIKSISVSTEVPRHSAIHNLRNRLQSPSLREPPLADPTSALKQRTEALYVALREYQWLCGNGVLMEQLRAAFVGLRVNGNADLTLVIHNGRHGIYERHDRSLESLETLDIGTQATCFTHILRHNKVFVNDSTIQMTVLLALASSGVVVQRLCIPAEAELVAFAWEDTHPLIDKEIIKFFDWTSYAPVFTLQKLHIQFDLGAESWERSAQNNFHANSTLMRLVRHLTMLDDLTLEGPYRLSRFDASPFLYCLPQKQWRALHLRSLSIVVDTLKHLLEVNNSALVQLDLDGVELILPSGEVTRHNSLQLTAAHLEESEYGNDVRELCALLRKNKRNGLPTQPL